MTGKMKKRKKDRGFTVMGNDPIRGGLNYEPNAMGVLLYMMSLSNDWDLYKTHLQKLFGRRRLNTAWKVIVECGYLVGFSCRVKGQKKDTYFYFYDDEKITQETFNEFVYETISDEKEKGNELVNIKPIMDMELDIPSDIWDVHFAQSKMDDPKRVTNKELISKELINKKDVVVVDAPIEFESTQKKSKQEKTDQNKSDELVALFESNICRLNLANKKDLITWLDQLPYEVIESEILYATEKGANGFPYLNEILKKNMSRGLATLASVEANRSDHASKKKTVASNPKRSSYKANRKPVRKEVEPSWFKDRNKETILPAPALESNDDDLEERKAQFLAKRKAKREAELV